MARKPRGGRKPSSKATVEGKPKPPVMLPVTLRKRASKKASQKVIHFGEYVVKTTRTKKGSKVTIVVTHTPKKK